MNIGIIGSGNIGGTLGTLWAKAGNRVMFSSRHPEQLRELLKAGEPLHRAAPQRKRLSSGEVVLFAIPYQETEATLTQEMTSALKRQDYAGCSQPLQARW